MTDIQHYIEKITQRYLTGKATEHSYRGDLQNLLETLLPNITITNEPTRILCGAPDYILTRGDLDIGWIEAKDIGKDLKSKEYQAQFERYRSALDNLIITDYLQFDFYRSGEKVASISIAQINDKTIQAFPQNFSHFSDLIKDFANYIGQSINSASQLSKIMAGKARLLANIIENALNSDEENAENSTLKDQLQAFKSILLHDITASEFADIYAQTIAYGLFAARLHDNKPDSFSRQTAAEKIPLSNPFLRKLFQYIAGYDLDKRIVWIVEALANIFRIVNTEKVWSPIASAIDESKKPKGFLLQDPIIHFYETFLAEYNPKLRKARGVWYTPPSVVNFIIRAVDDILKTEFQLNGLADTSKTDIEIDTPVLKGSGKKKYSAIEKQTKSVHKVQILDPATGTGTFLAETVKHIYANEFDGMQGAWSHYIEEHLIPRLNGFEILMASYAMAHLKLDLLLTETGYQPKKQPRFNIYLTNSLEEHHPDTHSLFATWLSQEANEANHIKRDTPVMVVLGNPPYSVSSSNKGDWILNLIADYKKDLNEKNIQPLSDDYIKFIRYGSHFIEKNGAGILAYISNNSFIDGLIHRQMRKHLLQTFDRIYILDCHGSNKKKETAPDGGKDENVFDIMQGVSINIFVKHPVKTRSVNNGITTQSVVTMIEGEKENSSLPRSSVAMQTASLQRRENETMATVYHKDLYGLRKTKYEFLENNSLASIDWQIVDYRAPEYLFVPKNNTVQKDYEKGFSIKDLFVYFGRGTSFRKDNLLVKYNNSKEDVIKMVNDVLNLKNEELKLKYNLVETEDWMIDKKRPLFSNIKEQDIKKVLYRPFDFKYTFFPMDRINKIIVRGDDKRELMRHLIIGENFGLICPKQSLEGLGAMITKSISDNKSVSAYNPNFIFPLYLYPESNQQTLDGNTRQPNLNPELIKQIAQHLNLSFVAEENLKGLQDLSGLNDTSFSPIDLLDYIYAVLHSPRYRETYKEFLKTDFPRVPYPDIKTFWQLVKLGGELRKLHLLESVGANLFATKVAPTYPIDGDNKITRKINKNDFELINNDSGRVYINDTQYFDNVPVIAWEFYIGGYQPAQKWLKDRHGRVLTHDDIKHYRKIITALFETHRIMQDIDTIAF